MKSFIALYVCFCAVLISGFPEIRFKRANENESWQALHRAAQSGDLQKIGELLKSRTDTNIKDNNNSTALHIAARYGKTEIVQILIENGANVNAKNAAQRTPLHEASYWGQMAVAKLLIEKGAEVNSKDGGNWTPLHLTGQNENVKNGKAELARLLLENGANVHAEDSTFKRTALHEAAVYGHLEVAKVLIEKGAHVNAEDNGKWTPLHLTGQNERIKIGKAEIARLLLENGANVNARDSTYNRTPIFEAAVYGQVDVAKTLIEKGAQVNVEDYGKWTPLHAAAQNEKIRNGKAEVARILLENGANVYAEDSTYKRSALHEAAIYGHADIAEVLINHKADVNAEDVEKWTPLHLAAQNWIKIDGKVEVVKVLIKHGAHVNAKGSNGRSVLHEAVLYVQVDTTRVLIKNRVDVNDVDNEKWTPLHIAAEKGSEEIIRLLLKNDAHKNVKTKDGETPLDIANRKGNFLVRNLFQGDIVRSVQSACLSYSADKIINGENATIDEFPWMAALGYLNERDYKISFDCGGTIISNTFILTAAHCVRQRLPVVVRLGKISLIDSDDEDDIRAINRNIKEIIVHPQHSIFTKQHDIALIRVKNRIPFSLFIRPACLQTDIRDEPPNVKLIVSGWGIISLEQKIRSSVLRKTHLTSMPLSECNSTLMNWNRPINDAALRNGLIGGQYCAYDPQGRNDSCQGDSGGPLQYFPNNERSVATVVGIVSFGVSCGTILPAIYTRIAYYIDWIEPIVWPSL